jgi:hypothetical protein
MHAIYLADLGDMLLFANRQRYVPDCALAHYRLPNELEQNKYSCHRNIFQCVASKEKKMLNKFKIKHFCHVAGGTDYVVATTNILSGDRLIDLVTQKMNFVSLNPF